MFLCVCIKAPFALLTILKVKVPKELQLFLLARESKEGEHSNGLPTSLVPLVLPVREETRNYNLGADHVNARDNKNRKRNETRLLGYLCHKQQDIKVRDCRVCLGPDQSLYGMRGLAVIEMSQESTHSPSLHAEPEVCRQFSQVRVPVAKKQHLLLTLILLSYSRSQGPKQACEAPHWPKANGFSIEN